MRASALSLLLVGALAGCGKPTTTDPAPVKGTSPTEPPVAAPAPVAPTPAPTPPASTGSATASSAGSGSSDPASSPEADAASLQGVNGALVSLGTLTVTGDLVTGDDDQATIRRYIKRNIQYITQCYENELQAAPTLSGTLEVKFTIRAGGTVANATATGFPNQKTQTCVAAAVKRIKFPEPKSREVVANYPLTFRPPPDAH